MAVVEAVIGQFMPGYQPFRAFCESERVAGKTFNLMIEAAAPFASITAEFVDDSMLAFRAIPGGRDRVPLFMYTTQTGPVDIVIVGRTSEFLTAGIGVMRLNMHPAAQPSASSPVVAAAPQAYGDAGDLDNVFEQIDEKFDNMFRVGIPQQVTMPPLQGTGSSLPDLSLADMIDAKTRALMNRFKP